MADYAGGYKVFGPTYNSTKYVRFGHEGTVNSMHNIDPLLIPSEDTKTTACEELAGKIAAINKNGEVTICDNKYNEGSAMMPIGLFVDDLGDIVNASNKGSFYFRGGEYFISLARMHETMKTVTPGTWLYVTEGGLISTSNPSDDTKFIGVATTAPQVFTTGNMYENAGVEANGGLFVGVSLRL